MISNKIRFTILIISLFLLGIASMAVSTSAKSQVVEITFWYTENDTEKPGVIDLVDKFEEENPTISVTALQKGFFDARALYTNTFIAGTEPELFRAARDWVTEYAAAGMISPVTNEFNQSDLDDFVDSAIRLVSYPDADGNNQIWGFPQLIDTPALMYNRHLFEEAGINTSEISINTSWTWTEFIANAKLLTNTTKPPQYGYTMAGMFFGAQAVYFGHGARLFHDGIVDINHVAINDTEAREALTFVKNLIEVEKITPPWEQQGWETISVLFQAPTNVSGQVAMIQQGPWELKNYLDNSLEFNPTKEGAKPYASADNLGIMQLPHDEEGHQGAPLGGHAYVISSFATGLKYEAAVKLAKFLTSPDSMAEGAIKYYHVPARKSVMLRTDVMNADTYEYVLGFKKNVDRAYQVPVSHIWAELEEDFANNIDEYLADDISLDECIAQTITEWKESLSQEVIEGTSLDTSEQLGEETPGFSWLFVILALPVTRYFLKKRKFPKLQN